MRALSMVEEGSQREVVLFELDFEDRRGWRVRLEGEGRLKTQRGRGVQRVSVYARFGELGRFRLLGGQAGREDEGGV